MREEFEAFLRCGVRENGFLRAVCEQCHADWLLAFSCKKRGFCPSCGARRMAENARHLVAEVFGLRPVRQWVLSFPVPLRVWEATDPAGYSGAIERLAPCLPIDGESERIGAMAQKANVPFPFARVLVTGWAENGRIEFVNGYSPPEMGLVRSVAESFRRLITAL